MTLDPQFVFTGYCLSCRRREGICHGYSFDIATTVAYKCPNWIWRPNW